MNQAEDAMEAQNYEQALANIDSVLAQDSANVDAYLMRASLPVLEPTSGASTW